MIYESLLGFLNLIMIFVSGRKTSSTIWTRFVPLYLNIWPLTVTGLSIPTMMIWLICWQLRLNPKRFVFTWNCVYHPRGLFQVSILLLKYCCTKWRTWADRIIKPIPITCSCGIAPSEGRSQIRCEIFIWRSYLNLKNSRCDDDIRKFLVTE